MNGDHYYKQYTNTEIAFIGFIVISIMNIIILETDKKQLFGIPPKFNVATLTEITLYLALLVYIYFLIRDLNELNYLKKDPCISNQKIINQTLRIVISIIFVLAGITFIYIEKNKNG